MTVITPVFIEGRGDGTGPAFFVASRGHHADVGGIAPGSMPPLSKTLEEVTWASMDRGKGCGGGWLFEHATIISCSCYTRISLPLLLLC